MNPARKKAMDKAIELSKKLTNDFSKFNYLVFFIHDDGTSFTINNCYCEKFEKYLLIIPEHHEMFIEHLDELSFYAMYKQVDIATYT